MPAAGSVRRCASARAQGSAAASMSRAPHLDEHAHRGVVRREVDVVSDHQSVVGAVVAHSGVNSAAGVRQCQQLELQAETSNAYPSASSLVSKVPTCFCFPFCLTFWPLIRGSVGCAFQRLVTCIRWRRSGAHPPQAVTGAQGLSQPCFGSLPPF